MGWWMVWWNSSINHQQFYFTEITHHNIYTFKTLILYASKDKVTVCRSKKRYHWSKTCIICFYHQIPRLSADTSYHINIIQTLNKFLLMLK